MQINLEEIHAAAIDIAKKGGEQTLKFFKRSFSIERKDDQSPVTIADREAEQKMREAISIRFPDHGIIGEEFAPHNEKSRIQWVLDPIDGTRSFIHGVPLYTTLVGVLVDNEPVAGVIFAPALDELCEAARGKGARLNNVSCTVGGCQNLSEATFVSTDVTSHKKAGFQEPFNKLLAQTRLHRTWGDAYGHMLVATGRADLMLDSVLNIWDAAALLPVLQEAEGVFSDMNGKQTIHSGNGFSTNPALYEQVTAIFNHNS